MAKILQPTNKHRTAIQWCIKNDIKVSIHPTLKGLKVLIDDRGKKLLSPQTYTKTEANNKCWELYLYIYNKNFNKYETKF